MASPLLSNSYTFDPRSYYPLVSTVKRYCDPSYDAQDGLTLGFARGIGFTEEQWEPTIDDLPDLPGQQQENVKIRETWTIDALNHGDAALLNWEGDTNLLVSWAVLYAYFSLNYFPLSVQMEEYGRSVHAFLTGRGRTLLGSNLEGTVVRDFDFSSQTIVGIEHSMEALSLLFLLDFLPFIKGLFASIILVEPITMELHRHQCLSWLLAQLLDSRLVQSTRSIQNVQVA